MFPKQQFEIPTYFLLYIMSGFPKLCMSPSFHIMFCTWKTQKLKKIQSSYVQRHVVTCLANTNCWFLQKFCTYMYKPPNHLFETRNERNWQHPSKSQKTIAPYIPQLCCAHAYNFLTSLVWLFSPFWCSNVQNNDSCILYFQHRVERGLLKRKLMKVATLFGMLILQVLPTLPWVELRD